MEVEFDNAARRFRKDALDRKNSAASRKLQIAKQKEEYRAKQARWEAEAEARRQEQLAREAEAARQHEEDLARNRGVSFACRLRAELSTAAEAKGTRRSGDKVSLPRSASVELETQQASKNGQLFFELTAPDGETPMKQCLWPRHCVQETWGAWLDRLPQIPWRVYLDGAGGMVFPAPPTASAANCAFSHLLAVCCCLSTGKTKDRLRR